MLKPQVNKRPIPGAPAVGAAPASPASPTTSAPQAPGSVAGMSQTAGPISAAMGLGGGSGTGASAGNFTSGLAPVNTPKMAPVTNGDLSNPASIANLVQGYQNKANDANSQRYNQALGVMGNAQDSTNALYGAAQDTASQFGQQQLGRIQLNLQNDLGGLAQNAVSRGLGNTTIADTMQYMPKRLADDATLGVNQSVAQMRQGLDTQQAASQQSYGNQIAGLIGSRNDVGPDIGQYAALTQGSFAGNNGRGFPQRSGSITENPAPKAPSAPSTPSYSSPGSHGGYMNMGDPSQNFGPSMGGGFGGAGGMGGGLGGGGFGSGLGGGMGFSTGGAGNPMGNSGAGPISGSIGGGTSGDVNYGSNGDGTNWFMPNTGGNVGLDLGDGNGFGDTSPAGSAPASAPGDNGPISSAVGAPSGGAGGGGMQLGTPHPSIPGLVMIGANSNGPMWGTPDQIGQEQLG